MGGESGFEKRATSGIVSEIPKEKPSVQRAEVLPVAGFKIPERPKKSPEELAEIAVAENNLRRLGVSSRVSDSIDFQKQAAHYDEVRHNESRLQRKEEQRKKTLRQKIALSAAAFGVAAAGLFGLKGNAEKSVKLDENRQQPANESVMKAAEPDNDQGGVNENLQEMYRQGNEFKGLDYISEGSETDDLTKKLKDNLAHQKLHDQEVPGHKGEIDDGLDTSKLE